MKNSIHIKDIKQAEKSQIATQNKSLTELQQEIEALTQKENDILDLTRLSKSYLDMERDTETEFMRKVKTLKDNKQAHVIQLIQENALADVIKIESETNNLKSMLYDIEDYDTQKELNIRFHMSKLNPEMPVEIQQCSRDIKFFY